MKHVVEDIIKMDNRRYKILNGQNWRYRPKKLEYKSQRLLNWLLVPILALALGLLFWKDYPIWYSIITFAAIGGYIILYTTKCIRQKCYALLIYFWIFVIVTSIFWYFQIQLLHSFSRSPSIGAV